MPNYQNFILTTKSSNDSLVSLYPETTTAQVLEWNIGNCYGPYVLTLSSDGWVDNQQTISLTEITSSDIVYCLKILSGTQQEMLNQEESYKCLNPHIGVNSLNNQIQFTCDTVPQYDFQVQIYWTR